MTSSDTTSPILITGATGRHGGTGAHLVRRLREAGRSVRALVRRLDERTEPLQALGAEIVVGDLHDRASLVPALERSDEHTSELQSRLHLVCRLLLEKKQP